MEKEILLVKSVIKKITKEPNDYNLFKQGGCYIFALLLKRTLNKGELYKDNHYEHIYLKVGDKLIDGLGSYKYSKKIKNVHKLKDYEEKICQKEYKYNYTTYLQCIDVLTQSFLSEN